MTFLSIPPLIMAAIALYICVYHLVIYFKSRKDRVDLTFALMCLAIMLYDLCCAGNYNSMRMVDTAGWQRLQLLTLGFVAISLMWFVLDYTRDKTRKVAYGVTAFFSLCVLVQWIDRSDLTWILTQPLVKTFDLFGATITYHEVAQGHFTDLEAYGLLVFFTYIYWLSFHFYWKKDPVRGLPLMLAVTWFYLTMFEDVMVSAGFYSFIYTLEYGYVGFLLIMAYGQIIYDLGLKNKLRESQMMIAGILNAVPQSIFWKDREGIYLGCNENFSKGVGSKSPEQIIGKTDYDLSWSREEADAYRADDQDVVIRNKPKRHIVEPIQQADGTRLWVDTTKIPLVDGKGIPYGVLGVYEDITERKQAEEALRLAKERAEEANKAKSEFLNNIAHDFRTPMHAIMGFSAYFQSEQLTEKQRKYADIINEKSKGLLLLVEELLDVSRLESGRLELRSMEFDLKESVRKVVELARNDLMEKDVRLVCSIDNSIPRLHGDEGRLNQIITNLLSNAVKYTDKGEITVRVEREQEHCPEGKCRVRVSVKDTGLGIPDDKHEQIFDAFTRFHEFAGGWERGGVGLGLYITKTLVKLMGGTISVLSEVGVGTEFIVVFDFDIA